MLNQYKGQENIDIVYNEEKLGYTRNINKAIKLAEGHDVILYY